MATHAVAASGWDRRRLIYGDWTWLVRDGLDVFRLVFIAGTVAFAIQGRSTAVALAAASAVVLVGRVIDLPRWFDLGLLVALTLIAWGTALSLYGDWFYYDKVVHGISPVGYTPVLYLALVRLGVVPDPGRAITERRVARISGILVVTLAVGMAVGSAYESIEWIEDKFFGGHFVKGLWDTETDLLCDTGGSLVGALFLTVWALRPARDTRGSRDRASSAGARIRRRHVGASTCGPADGRARSRCNCGRRAVARVVVAVASDGRHRLRHWPARIRRVRGLRTRP
jgi:uncharacterized membrane protein YjdF